VTIITPTAGLDLESLELTLESIAEFAHRELPDALLAELAHRELPDALLVELDERDEFPEALVRRMCGDELGVQLLFVAEEHGGMGGSAFDVYRVCERMAAIDVGIATSVLATFLGSDRRRPSTARALGRDARRADRGRLGRASRRLAGGADRHRVAPARPLRPRAGRRPRAVDVRDALPSSAATSS
jgi:alkylation response protein AidB-like acyl-CoA dehydrogenase